VIERMVNQGSTVVKADILSVLEDYHTAIENMVLEGMHVNTPGANFGVSVKGIFNGQADGYDASRHQVSPAVSPGRRFRHAIKERAKPMKQETIKPEPNPLEFTDINSADRNSLLTPGGMGKLIGHRLKFDPLDDTEGIYFVAEDGTETKVAVVGNNKPGNLLFLIPDSLTTGDYTVEVRTKLGSESLHIGVLDAPLTVT
jgi:hypothetical protein